MRATFFGSVSVTDATGKTTSVFRTQKMLTLLALLTLRQGRAISRDELAEQLWPEQDPDKQRARLRNEISLLTHVLGADAILREGNRAIALAPFVMSDSTEFDIALQAAKTARTPQERIDYLRAAARLQQTGEFMSGFYEDEILAARAAFLTDFQKVLSRLIAELYELDQLEEADYWRLFYRRRFPVEAIALANEDSALDNELAQLAPKLEAPHAPTYRDGFHGREAEREVFKKWLAAKRSPVMTITGSPGVGKTRLSVELLPEAVFVSLAEISEPRYFWETLALALHGYPQPNAREASLQRLRASDTLLVLDNFEHIVEAGAKLLETLLAAAPRLRCIVTSRVRLAIAGEEELHLSALPDAEGQALFLERARAARSDFADSEAVTAVCTLLEGVPLALELAATHAATLSAEQMARQLQEHLTALAGARGDFAPRHRSLRAAFEQSLNLLPADARRAFTLLAAFWGTFTLGDAEIMLHGDVASVPDVLQTLRAHSLLQVKSTTTAPEYRLLFALREFGREQQSHEDTARMRLRHAKAIASCVQAGRMDCEYADIDTALASLNDTDSTQLSEMVLALQALWEGRGLIPEGIGWTCAALDGEVDPAKRIRLLVSLSSLQFYADRFDAAEKAAQDAVAQAKALGDATLEVPALRALAHVLTYTGNRKEAGKLLQEAGQRLRTLPDGGEACGLFYVLGVAANCVEEYETARFYLAQAERLARQKGDTMTALLSRFYHGETWVCEERFDASMPILEEVRAEAQHASILMMVAYAEWGLGHALLGSGNANDAAPLFRATTTFLIKTGHQWGISLAIEAQAYCDCARGNSERAILLLAWAERRREALHFPHPPCYTSRHERYLNRLRSQLTTQQFDLYWQSGALLSSNEAHALALQLQ